MNEWLRVGCHRATPSRPDGLAERSRAAICFFRIRFSIQKRLFLLDNFIFRAQKMRQQTIQQQRQHSKPLAAFYHLLVDDF